MMSAPLRRAKTRSTVVDKENGIMESRRTQRDGGGVEADREVIPPVGADERSTHPANANVYGRDIEASPPIGPRVRWGGVMSGFVVAMGTILLLTSLGMAIGITTLNDPRATTQYVDSGLGAGASIWGAITLLLACFFGGMVSTRVTDRPDRGGAFIHGTLVWTLVAVFLIWLLGQGISFGLSNLFGALGGLTRTAGTAVTSAVTGDVDLAQRLGLDRQWLHAVRLGFEHPGTGEQVEYEASYPDDLARALEIIRDAD